jgi:hypothetical protein
MNFFLSSSTYIPCGSIVCLHYGCSVWRTTPILILVVLARFHFLTVHPWLLVTERGQSACIRHAHFVCISLQRLANCKLLRSWVSLEVNSARHATPLPVHILSMGQKAQVKAVHANGIDPIWLCLKAAVYTRSIFSREGLVGPKERALCGSNESNTAHLSIHFMLRKFLSCLFFLKHKAGQKSCPIWLIKRGV